MLQSDGKIQKEDTADWKNYTYSKFSNLDNDFSIAVGLRVIKLSKSFFFPSKMGGLFMLLFCSFISLKESLWKCLF